MSDGFINAINRMSGEEVKYTFKDLKDVLVCALSIIDSCESTEVLNEEDSKLFNLIKLWNENSKDIPRPHTAESKQKFTEALRKPVSLLVMVGKNKMTIDISQYSTMREAINNITERIYTTLGDGISYNKSFLIDFKGSTYSFNYNPKDTEYIAFKIEEGLHKLLTKHF